MSETEKRPKKKGRNEMRAEDIYPPRRGWKVCGVSNSRGLLHRGYSSPQLKTCPCCGGYPVFEESVDAVVKDVQEPVRVFVGICPKCEIRTRKSGTLKETVIMWQRREYSKDSILMNKRPKYDWIHGVRELSQKIVDAAVADAIMYAQQRQEDEEGSEHFLYTGDQLEDLERFFHNSVFMWEMHPDGIISDIRRILYPDLPPEWRTKIPPHLTRLYEGKKVVAEWKRTQKTNS